MMRGRGESQPGLLSSQRASPDLRGCAGVRADSAFPRLRLPQQLERAGHVSSQERGSVRAGRAAARRGRLWNTAQQ